MRLCSSVKDLGEPSYSIILNRQKNTRDLIDRSQEKTKRRSSLLSNCGRLFVFNYAQDADDKRNVKGLSLQNSRKYSWQQKTSVWALSKLSKNDSRKERNGRICPHGEKSLL